ncbi:MAG: acyl-CoA thioesterase [Eubacterium sp.]|nr:acyl-CoA thioesterase [Eubacterium sp.]HBE09747.1 acyl-CoA thioesterase [Lachnospiraceae bacterium]
MSYEKGYKKVSDSQSEWMKCIQYEDINGSGRLFGGRLMEWMDEVAGIAALRHSGKLVTTVAVDNLKFKSGAYINDVVVIISRITYVGNTSMEVRVDVYFEDRETGTRRMINRAYFTEVCIDEEGHPVPVPYGIEPETESEKAEYEGALKRIEMRKLRRSEGF